MPGNKFRRNHPVNDWTHRPGYRTGVKNPDRQPRQPHALPKIENTDAAPKLSKHDIMKMLREAQALQDERITSLEKQLQEAQQRIVHGAGQCRELEQKNRELREANAYLENALHKLNQPKKNPEEVKPKKFAIIRA